MDTPSFSTALLPINTVRFPWQQSSGSDVSHFTANVLWSAHALEQVKFRTVDAGTKTEQGCRKGMSDLELLFDRLLKMLNFCLLREKGKPSPWRKGSDEDPCH